MTKIKKVSHAVCKLKVAVSSDTGNNVDMKIDLRFGKWTTTTRQRFRKISCTTWELKVSLISTETGSYIGMNIYDYYSERELHEIGLTVSCAAQKFESCSHFCWNQNLYSYESIYMYTLQSQRQLQKRKFKEMNCAV